ncbi:MAG: ABC transporter ATP-binding protein [Candidatus Hodarchaeaceae archaeon]|nr:ABC transporter ATP-binding protein [Candidatus Hodarchaeaceae archaeon]
MLNPLKKILLRRESSKRSRSAAARKPKLGEILVRAEGICKGFPGVWEHLILDRINFDVKSGEVHALLGENGAGKTVLANILSGFYSLSKGRIYARGKPISIKSPKDALEHGIGMVHQEFTLARPLTVAENVALGLAESNFSFPLSKVEKRIRELSDRYGLKVDPKARVEELSAGEQQRVEILKTLYHEPEVIILDEPTSVLTPEESKRLFSILRAMAREGRGVVFITHKLEEVMEVSDRVTVLRLGKLIGTRKTSETNRRELVRMMMGREVTFRPKRKPVKLGEVALEVKDLHVLDEKGLLAVKGISLTVREGEILGIAGVAGNGQSELVEAITGLREVIKGKVLVFGKDVTNHSPKKLMEAGMVHIPEERRRMGVAEGMTSAENLIMKDYRTSPFSRWTFLNRSFITRHTERMVSEYDIMVPDLWRTETRILSGGNIQRLILARETWREPRLIVAVHPTYGLDLKALRHTHDLFLRLKEKGTAILLVSEDLDEVMSLSDRIAVIFEGKIVGTVDAARAKVEKIGLMMAGSKV